jgi:hypothetical protein
VAHRRRLALALAGLGCAVGVPIAAVTAQEHDPGTAKGPEVEATVGDRPAASKQVLECTGAQEPANFRIYSAGREFDGLPLTTVIRRCDNADPMGSANYVSYIYGTCTPQPAPGKDYVDSGCAPPLEIQTWPSCERTFGHYQGSARARMRPELRGVPVAEVDDWVELYTADSTVVVFGTDPERVERAIAAVQPLERGASPATFPPRLQRATSLPAPEPGALSVGKECSS